MFLFEKKIIYLSQYQDGVREASAGFVRFLREKNVCVLDIHIQSEHFPDGDYTLSLVIGNREIEWERLPAAGGRLSVHRQIELKRDSICIRHEEYKEDDLQGIVLHIDGQSCIAGYFKESSGVPVTSDPPENMNALEENKQAGSENVSEEKIGLCAADETSQHKLYMRKNNTSDGKMQVEEPISEDKWEQLQKSYQKVHPFGD